MKILHLPIKKHWFDMIKSGEKKEEYREIKDYWENRFFVKTSRGYIDSNSFFGQIIKIVNNDPVFKQFDIVRFKNGYHPNDPVMDVEFNGFEIREGTPEWGAVKGEEYFVIKLGEILEKL